MQLYTLNHAHCQGWGQSCFKWGCRTHNAPAEVHHFGPWSATAAHGLPWGDHEDVKDAGPDTVGKPQTEQRQLSKVRQPAWVLLSTLSPHSQTSTVSGTLRSDVPPVLYTPDPPGKVPRSADLVRELAACWYGEVFCFLLSPNFSKEQSGNALPVLHQSAFCGLLYLVYPQFLLINHQTDKKIYFCFSSNCCLKMFKDSL